MAELIDFETFVKVRRLAPVVMEPDVQMAKTLLDAMVDIMNGKKESMDDHGEAFWAEPLKDLAVWFPEGVKSHQVGRAARALGLKLRRVGAGYQVLWRREQVDILRAAFRGV